MPNVQIMYYTFLSHIITYPLYFSHEATVLIKPSVATARHYVSMSNTLFHYRNLRILPIY